MKKPKSIEYEKLSDEKVLVRENVPATIKKFQKDGAIVDGPVEVGVTMLLGEETMNEKWMREELIALRSTVNVAMTTANGVASDVARIKQEMLHPTTGKRLWDGIGDEKTTLQAQEAMDMKLMSDRIDALEKQVDALLDLVQKLVTGKEEKGSGGRGRLVETDAFQELLKKIGQPVPHSVGGSTNIGPARNQRYTFGGPYYEGPTLFSDIKSQTKGEA